MIYSYLSFSLQKDISGFRNCLLFLQKGWFNTEPLEHRMEPNRDNEDDERSKPGIQRPGQQPDQKQLAHAPPQPRPAELSSRSSQWIPPTTGNPDLDPAGVHPQGSIDLRERDPLVPQGMIFDPGQLLDYQRPSQPDFNLPPGARFDPFGPPDPSQVGPGRGPPPSFQFGTPDPDHQIPPGMPQSRNAGKTFKDLGLGSRFPPPGGAGGSRFL